MANAKTNPTQDLNNNEQNANQTSSKTFMWIHRVGDYMLDTTITIQLPELDWKGTKSSPAHKSLSYQKNNQGCACSNRKKSKSKLK